MRSETLARRAVGLNLALLFAAVLWLRVTSLEAIPEVCGDECWYGVQMAKLLQGRPFEIRTFSGHPLNPFFSGPIALLLLVFEPSGWIVRAPAVVSGVLAVGASYWLGSKALDRTTGRIAATLMAVLPIAIVYSRTGFDCSQLPLFNLLAILCAFRGNRLGLALAFLASFVVHPVSIFLLPVILAIDLTRAWRAMAGDGVRRVRLLLRSALVSAGVIAAAGVFTLQRPFVRDYFKYHYRAHHWAAVPTGLGRFLLALALPPHEPPLWEGWTSPTGPATVAQELSLFGLVVLGLLIFGVRRLVLDGRWERLALIVGLGVSVLGFHVVAGSQVLNNSTYRYGAFLIAPAVLALACLIEATLAPPHEEQSRADRRFQLLVLSLSAWALLVIAKVNWFDSRTRGTAESVWTLRSDRQDRFKLALSLIRHDQRRLGGASATRIIAEDYWTYRPLQFYAIRQPQVEIDSMRVVAVEPEHFRPEGLGILRDGGYAVGLKDGALEQTVTASYPPDRLRRWDLFGRDRKWVVVFRLQR
jgi:hypothetical protein